VFDAKAYQQHFPDDPSNQGAIDRAAPRPLSSPALRQAFAALESDLKAILRRAEKTRS
jgi:hypothetical protein